MKYWFTISFIILLFFIVTWGFALHIPFIIIIITNIIIIIIIIISYMLKPKWNSYSLIDIPENGV
jgi:hypothetical protein